MAIKLNIMMLAASATSLVAIRAHWTGYKKPASIYSAWNGLWGMLEQANLSLVKGVDWDVTTYYNPATFPNGTIIEGFVPKTIDRVWGYPAVAMGNGDYSGQLANLPPARIYEIDALNIAYDIELVSEENKTAILVEAWPTVTAHNNNSMDDKSAEIGMFPTIAAGTISFMNGGVQLGTWVDPGGRSWTLARNTNPFDFSYLTARPTDGVSLTSATLYFGAYCNHLASIGEVDGRHYINGVMGGPEPMWGTFRAKFNTFERGTYTYSARVPRTTTLSASSPSPTTVQLTFITAPGANSHEYQIGSGTWTAVPGDKLITGLTAFTDYTFKIRGVNDFGGAGLGKGTVSNTVAVKTQAVVHDMDFSAATPVLKWNGSDYSTLNALFTAAGRGSFSRASTGYNMSASTQFATNAPRITSGVGLLVEPEMTNHLLYTHDFDNSAWIKDAEVTLTANFTTAPDGTTTAERFQVTNQWFKKALQYANMAGLTGQPVTVSLFAKENSGDRDLQIDFQSPTTIGTAVVPLTTTWTRASLSGTTGTTGGNFFIYGAGGPDSDLVIWGAQVEVGAKVSSYYPSLANTKGVRAADVLSLPIPTGITGALITFADNTSQVVSGLTAGGTWAVPTNLNKSEIKYIDWQA